MFDHVKCEYVDEMSADAWLCPVFSHTPDQPADALAQVMLKDASAALNALQTRPDWSASAGQVACYRVQSGTNMIFIGIGESSEPTRQTIDAAAWHTVQTMRDINTSTLFLPWTMGDDTFRCWHALFVESFTLAAMRFNQFKQNGIDTPLFLQTIDENVHPILAQAVHRGSSVNFARHLAGLPANIATPDMLADEAQTLAKQHDTLTCNVYRDQALQEMQCIGLVTVGNASEHKPCLIELIYEPTTPQREPCKTIALVGKSITFDSGGLSVKINDTMVGMKYDMAAGAAVLGAMRAIAHAQPNARVVGLLPAAENAIGSKAFRVDDVLHYPNGVNVEITNTDYEGRLVLADAMIHACREHQLDILIDLGTLTGEIIQGLGKQTAGLWCANDDLRARMVHAGDTSGDSVWPMPLTDEHRQYIKSDYADIVNLALTSPGKPPQCAAFLEHFVTPNVQWAHLDIAGPVSTETPRPPYVPGATGFGVRLLLDTVTAYADSS